MFQDNALLAQLKQQIRDSTPRIQGVVKSTDKGFGFIEGEGQKSYFIPPLYMKRVLHGDRITAVLQSEKGQTIAEPETLIEMALTTFVGRLCKKEGQWAIIPDHALIKNLIPCRPMKAANTPYNEGDWVRAALKQHPLKGDRRFQAEITGIITDSGDNFAPWWVTLARHHLALKDPPECSVPIMHDQTERIDLTHLPFITIDSASTQDIDDALSVTVNPEGSFTLAIAIADPTAYVALDSPMDQMARQRAFTHYLPGLNIPMLPRSLSEDLCSLQLNARRPALVCQMVVEKEGTLREPATFCLAWIVSKAKLNYDQVSDWLEGNTAWQPDTPAIAEQIKALLQVTTIRSAWRQQHAILFKERPEYRFVLDQKGNVTDIAIESRRIAHRMIEEAMISANLCAATLLRDQLGYGVFTVHAGLEAQHLQSVLAILNAEGAPAFQAEHLLTLPGFCDLRRYLDAQPTAYLASRLRRYQTVSTLSCQPAAHFGLGFAVYATWTSPIRKYSDLVNHRLLKAVITQSQPIQEPDQALIVQLNERRRQHRLAERQVNEWLYARFLQNKADRCTRIAAEVMDVTRGGLRVRLLNNGAVVFLPLAIIHPVREELVLQQDNTSLTLKGETLYRLGDRLEVVLNEVRLETRTIIASPAA